MFTIRKTFRFEAAHRLVHGYQGKCAHIHGHSWSVTVILQSEKLNGYGMVRDFGDVKALRKWVDDNLDHAAIVSKVDRPLLDWLVKNEQRHYVLPSMGEVTHPNPTSENLCRFLYYKAHELGLKECVAIEIKETCTSDARFENGKLVP